MTDIIISISLYIIVAILLGFTFGWFIAKAVFKEKFQKEIEALSTKYDVDRGMLQLEQDKKISELQDKIRRLKREHENEVSAFLEERIDITTKYKELLDNVAA